MYVYGSKYMQVREQNRKVVIYARVSTEHDAQLAALENQVDWYKPILAAHPEWTLVEQYVDKGITGTSATKRPKFMQMIEDAKARKFDLILTREVSRFARNTVDTLQYTRMLKEKNVEVFFVNDNIKTFDGDGELRLTIMATLAQDESRKTSIRVKSGQQTSMDNGVFFGNGSVLGYNYNKFTKEVTIDPEQAETVRMIYDMYLSGMGVSKIAYELEKAGRLTSMGKTKWFPTVITKVLSNSFYCGIITYHKQFTPDFLKQKKINNYGEIEFTKVQGTHTPIVTVEEYERVQQIKNSKRQKSKNLATGRKSPGAKPRTTAWGRLLLCECGCHFNIHYSDRPGRTEKISYICYGAANRGSQRARLRQGLSVDGVCDSPFLPEWKLRLMAEKVFDKVVSQGSAVVGIAQNMLEKHISDKEEIVDNSDLISEKMTELQRLEVRRNNLIEMRADGDITKELFRKKKQAIEADMERLSREIETLAPKKEKTEEIDMRSRLKELEDKLNSYIAPGTSGDIPESIVEAFIRQIVVSKEGFKWYMRLGNDSVVSDEDDYKEGHIKIAEFKIDFDDAKHYLYEFSPRRRIYNWFDLNVSVWV